MLVFALSVMDLTDESLKELHIFFKHPSSSSVQVPVHAQGASSTSKMMSIDHLPLEVLESIFSQISDRKDLFQARLACKKFADVGAKFMFRRVYLAPRFDRIRKFQEITEHAIFSKTIHTIVYDCRPYCSRVADELYLYALHISQTLGSVEQRHMNEMMQVLEEAA